MTTAVHNADAPLLADISRRRTFAIISHPDAGKTTLTEKFLLYAGAVQEAGAVKSRRQSKTATSDWMELEKQRGISISSTVLHFAWKDRKSTRLNSSHANISYAVFCLKKNTSPLRH